MIEVDIFEPKSDAELSECRTLMKVLRPHLGDMQAWVAQLERQALQGYALLAAWQHGTAVGLAGYRFQENLLYGRFLYVDDLVTTPALQSRGIGAQLLAALGRIAKESECKMLVLDTSAQSARAQQFYKRQGMQLVGVHLTRTID